MPDQHEDLKALYVRAMELHSGGQADKAVPLYRRIVSALPDADIVHYNLGLALFETGRYGEAVHAFQTSTEHSRDDPDGWYNLGLAHSRAGAPQKAAAAYLRACELRPGDADILHNLGLCLKGQGLLEQAVEVYEELLQIHPEYRPGMNNLAALCHLLGRFDRAAELYRQLLQLDPGHAAARHMLAALDGRNTAVPDPGYIEALFDHFSGHFEEKLLDTLQYRVPELLPEAVRRRGGEGTVYERVLDLGCGTGLVGEQLRPLSGRLTGVDLSGNMLEQARAKAVYDELVQAEAVDFLEGSAARWDMIVAADVLNYLGNLEPLLRAVAERLAPGGLFCCTTELLGGAEQWQLQANGRYGHGKEYLRGVSLETGFSVLEDGDELLRQEGQGWVQGTLWLLERTT